MSDDLKKAERVQAGSALMMLFATPFLVVGQLIAWPFVSIAEKIKGRKRDEKVH